MSLKLRDLIRQVRKCKTAAEERAVIAREAAMIRTAIREEQEQYRHRNVAKLLFMHMLGYPTHFGQLECLKLIASPHFPEKRIGYLGLLLLLPEEAEVLMLATNTLKNDMNSPNRFAAGLALVAFGNLATADMGRDLASEVDRHLKSTSPYLRKKAALAMSRCLTKVPEMIEDFADRMVSLLKDRNHGVLLTAVQLQRSMGYAPELEVGGVTDPFLQVQLLTLLRLFGKDNDEASEHMNDVLAQVANTTVTEKNAGNAVVYECVRTVMSVRTETTLRVQAVNVLGKFLTNRDNNIRYVALNSLAQVVREDPAAVGRHRDTIVECLKDPDISIRARALELIYRLVNRDNVEVLMAELLNYLVVAPADQRTDICARVLKVTDKFSPDDRWRLDTLITLLSIAGRQCERNVLSSTIVYVSRSSDDLRAYATHKLAKAVRDDDGSQEGLLIVGIWCIGEYGDLLLKPYQYTARQLQGGENVLAEPEVIRFSAFGVDEIVDIVKNVTTRKSCPQSVMEFGLTCFVKLSERFQSVANNTEILEKLRNHVQKQKTSYSLEMQIRSCEYSMLFSEEAASGARKALARMPMVDASLLRRKRMEADAEAVESEDSFDMIGNGLEENDCGPLDGTAPKGDLLDLNFIFNSGETASTKKPAVAAPIKNISNSNDPASVLFGETPVPAAKSDLDLLSDIFSTPVPTTEPAPLALNRNLPSPAPNNDIMDLLGPSPATETLTPTLVPVANPMLPMNIFSQPPVVSAAAAVPIAQTLNIAVSALGASPVDPFTAMASPDLASPQNPLVNCFDKDGLSIIFECQKLPDLTELVASLRNSNVAPITDLSLKVAVPKFLKMQIFPPSSTTVTPGHEVFQKIHITNSMRGQKKIVLKIKVDFMSAGIKKDHVVTCSGFPEGY
eukprot:CAMPEP_0113321680 /NCGR_PEP_ID=MMETSP0010_2-20120614/15081_1 /TAXON_ID=216773 ORGANISM="Corethron hystrix, Strain 308" /NCGR_SAMPLE_ID=MMETSP0010_2 /ASSEMBLY_ACC=CAM_ASM_000155 /LENGTH=902 /DNA_ID=CAMNT_0000179889 /DNA_START=136 /DNA_END=2845 /DNA_ORIENTATION=- /assembly_acc=CAM_ASM_000155